jgi:competence protein ComEA
MRTVAIIALMLAVLVGCTREARSPDAVRNDAAAATAGAVRNAKAVAQGVVEGLRQKGPVNINSATKEDLLTLPGITPAIADTIVRRRPYQTGSELVKRHIVTRAEYNQISNKIEAR